MLELQGQRCFFVVRDAASALSDHILLLILLFYWEPEGVSTATTGNLLLSSTSTSRNLGRRTHNMMIII